MKDHEWVGYACENEVKCKVCGKWAWYWDSQPWLGVNKPGRATTYRDLTPEEADCDLEMVRRLMQE